MPIKSSHNVILFKFFNFRASVIDNSTNNLSGNVGMVDEYKGKTYDHWGRAHLNSLCDKGIIDTVDAWVDHWDEPLIKSECMALIYKAFFK